MGIYKRVRVKNEETQEFEKEEAKLNELGMGESFGEIALLKGNKGFRVVVVLRDWLDCDDEVRVDVLGGERGEGHVLGAAM